MPVGRPKQLRYPVIGDTMVFNGGWNLGRASTDLLGGGPKDTHAKVAGGLRKSDGFFGGSGKNALLKTKPNCYSYSSSRKISIYS